MVTAQSVPTPWPATPGPLPGGLRSPREPPGSPARPARGRHAAYSCGGWAKRDQRGGRDILGGMWHISDHGRRLHSGADVGRLRVCPPRRRDRRPPWLSRDTLCAPSLTATPTRAVWGVSAWSAPPMIPRAILLSAGRVFNVFVTPTGVVPIPARPRLLPGGVVPRHIPPRREHNPRVRWETMTLPKL